MCLHACEVLAARFLATSRVAATRRLLFREFSSCCEGWLLAGVSEHDLICDFAMLTGFELHAAYGDECGLDRWSALLLCLGAWQPRMHAGLTVTSHACVCLG